MGTFFGTGYNFGGFAVAGGAPTDPSGTPYVHWEADSGLAYVDGNLISTWSDQIGSKDLTAAGGGRPTYKTNIQNGLPCVRYAGGNVMSCASGVFGTPTQPLTLFMAINITSLNNNTFFFDSIDVVTGCYCRNFSTTLRYNFGGVEVDSGHTVTTGNQILVWTINNASTTVRKNGVEISSGGAPGTNGFEGFYLGRPSSASVVMDEYEVIIYSGVESPTDNETYLNNKWNIY